MKIFRWFSKLIVSTVLISFLSVLTAWYVVNLYTEEIFRQYQLPELGKKIQFSDFVARFTKDLNIVKPRDVAKDSNKAEKSTTGTDKRDGTEETPTSARSTTPSPEGTTNPAGSSITDSKLKDDAVAVWGRAQKEKESGTQKREVLFSTEEFAKKKEMLSNKDKMKIFSIVISKLPQEEVQHLSALLEDGITAEELQEVEQILQKYLKKEEYQQLLDIMNKY